jgi:hypothetical protein
LDVREIRVQLGRQGFRRHELRLCTSLLDHRTAPALDLARLYATRWEHELYFRNAKRVLRQTAVVQSHTVDTAAQEIAAIILVTAMLARERLRAANGQIPVLRLKFAVMLGTARGLTDRETKSASRPTQSGTHATLVDRPPSLPHESARGTSTRDQVAAALANQLDRRSGRVQIGLTP